MIKAAIFDWAGTTVDYGSRAPMGAFVKLFKAHQINITMHEARIPMGTNKWDHIDALLNMPRVSEQWQRLHGYTHSSEDVDRLLAEFIPMNKLSIVECSGLIPGVPDLMNQLKNKGIRVGSTTGYTKDLMAVLLPLAAEQGYTPEFVVCAGDTPQGRPSPQMMEKCSKLMHIHNPQSFVKVDDTLPGIEEGRNFGCWTVGVALSGNTLGLSEDELSHVSDVDRQYLENKARKNMAGMKPDYVIDTVADLVPIIDVINFRIRQGHKPNTNPISL